MPTALENETREAGDVLVRVPERSASPEAAKANPARQPPHAVILHNDPINGFDYVVRTLNKVLHCGNAKAIWLTLKAHTTGKSCVWSGMKEHAELKADQLRSCGPDPAMISKGAQTLSVTIEPQPV